MKKKLPIFPTSYGLEKYLAAYEAMFILWRVPHDSIDVKTRYGFTHINVSGPSDGRPLVLLHAAGLTSTAWFANIAELSESHQVYGIDVIGDAGRSTAECVMANRSEYAEWLKEVFDRLNLENAYLLGHSYGGWLTLNMALVFPERLKAIVLLAPAASIYRMNILTHFGLRLSAFRFLRPKAKSLFKMIAKGTEFDETFIHLMEMATRHCLPAMMFPTVYTDEELKRIDLPTLLLIGSKERIYNLSKAIRRAERLMPNLTAEIVPNVGHTLNMEKPEIINSRILQFLSSV